MSGEVRRKYVHEMQVISSQIYKRIKEILFVFPLDYNLDTIIKIYKQCYPFEYNQHIEMINNYKKKDCFLKRKKGKSRYDIDSIKKLFLNNVGIKNILSKSYQCKRQKDFQRDDLKIRETINKLKNKSDEKQQKINNNRQYVQCCDPIYFDDLLGLYSRKTASLLDKELVIDEMLKYDGPKTYSFLMKLNDTEKNKDIRYKVFYAIQSYGHYVRLRKEFKGNKEPYVFESYNPENEILDEVGERINNKNKFESIKHYNLFISHNITDKDFALSIVRDLNKEKLTSYYCWIADNKKGHSKFLKEILDLRMKQSDSFIIINTNNYSSSKVCSYEYEYIKKSGKKFYEIVSENDYLLLKEKILSDRQKEE